MEKLAEVCPHKPWPKQVEFLDLQCKEALYGGAAGGGKSDALLMGALQYVHVPKYAALILRTSTTDLELSGGLIPRSKEWLSGIADWKGDINMWTFPNKASIQFGYLATRMHKYRYKSSEYQYIAFDELTEFLEEDYTYLFSRMRRTVDIDVPLRMRAGTNPGGPGHEWVKARFVPQEAEIDLKNDTLKGVYYKDSPNLDQKGKRTKIAFVPAKVYDNPSLVPEEYIANLMHLSPVERERLMRGDWTIRPEGLLKAKWLRYYTMRDRMIDLLVSRVDSQGNVFHTDEVLQSFHEKEARRFVTIDTAGGMKQISEESRGKPYSWFAAGVWDYKRWGERSRALVLRHVHRARMGFVEVANTLREIDAEWNPAILRVEDKTMGPDLFDLLKQEMPIELIASGTIDKVARSAQFQNMLSRGQVYLPRVDNSWRQNLEAEWLGWQGLKDETNDQVDMASYAAMEADGFGSGIVHVDVDPRKPIGTISGRMKWSEAW